MKKDNLLIVSLLLTIMIFVFTGCQGKKSEPQKTDVQTHLVTINVTTDNGKNTILKKTVKVENGENLYNVMKENFKIEDEKGMITSINDKKQDTQKKNYWMFNINNEPAMKGAKDIQLKNGDVITWDLHEAK
ncbi:TPA: DUF4430 domain-containing protein [Bacillus pseudomycoides]|nr:DUF4430 domain-containing protein [Bacillus pseudomycoides]